MAEQARAWDGDQVRKWLESRVRASKLDQAAADRQGYAARDDYDKAAAEEWACRTLSSSGVTADKAAFASRIKALIDQDQYPATGINDDQRFERHVRTNLRTIAKMVKANDGFGNTFRYQ